MLNDNTKQTPTLPPPVFQQRPVKQETDWITTALSILSPAIVFYIVIESASVICISKAKDEKGISIYNSATVVLFAELMKFFISLGGLWTEDPYLVTFRKTFSLPQFLRYGVPAALYAVNNNIFLFVLTLITPSIFQLLLNLRVVWTGVVFKFILDRPITKQQWLAMFALIIGCILVQREQAQLAAAKQVTDPSPLSPPSTSTLTTGNSNLVTSSFALSDLNPIALLSSEAGRIFFGLCLTVIYTFISTTASVVNEVMIKNSQSLHAANLQLYTYGIIFNVLGALFQASSSGGSSFRGWSNPIVWAIFMSMSFSGLMVSRVMQKYDNIVKIFCVSVSNFLVYTFAVVNDGEPLSLIFVFSFVLVSAGAIMYQNEKNRVDAEVKSVLAKKEMQSNDPTKVMVNGELVTVMINEHGQAISGHLGLNSGSMNSNTESGSKRSMIGDDGDDFSDTECSSVELMTRKA